MKIIIMLITLFGIAMGFTSAQASSLPQEIGTHIKLESSDHPMDVLEFKADVAPVMFTRYTIKESCELDTRCISVTVLPEGAHDTLIQSTSIGVARGIESVPWDQLE